MAEEPGHACSGGVLAMELARVVGKDQGKEEGWVTDSDSDSDSNDETSLCHFLPTGKLARLLFPFTSTLLKSVRNVHVRGAFLRQDLRKRIPRHLKKQRREGWAKYEERTYMQSLDTIEEKVEEI